MGFITNIWGTLEPILFGLQVLFGLRFTFHSKLTERQFELDANNSFDEICKYLDSFKVKDYFHSNREMYIRHLKNEINQKNNYYRFIEGELHYRLLQKAKLPKENRIDKFLIKSLLFVYGYKTMLSYLLFREKIRRIFKRKFSYYHFISIPNWRTKTHHELAKEVLNIKKIDQQLFERYKIPKNQDLKKTKPTISKAIDNVLSKGKISEKSIFNLATSEKLIFIHKYGEGFSNVYNKQQELRADLKQKVEKWEKSEAKTAERNLSKYKKELAQLNDNYLKVPIGNALENYGFQKLFSKMDGVYVLPLSLIPEKYHKDIDYFISEQIISKAIEYVNNAYQDGNQFIEEENLNLKYLILAHVIPVHEIKFIAEHRDIEYSSPVLSRMLLTSYLSNDNSKVSNLYIYDIVRNFDINSLLNENKTDLYIKSNIDNIKRLLWDTHKIDILKPYGLTILNESNIEIIVDRLLEIDNSIKRYLLKRKLIEIVDFYKKLDKELNDIKK